MTERGPTEPTKRDRRTGIAREMRIRAKYVPGLVLTQREVVSFLVRSADEYSTEVCEDDQCEVCDTFCAMWHDIYDALDASYRLVVEEALEALELRSPQPRHGGF